MINRLFSFYKNVVQKDLVTQQKTFKSFHNTQIDKVHIFLSLKPFSILNPNIIIAGWFFIEAITRQKVHLCFSKKDVAQWRLRKGILVGFSVVLRKDNLFSFLDKFFLLIGSQKKPFNSI